MRRILLAVMAVLVLCSTALAELHCDNCRMRVRDDSPYRMKVVLADGAEKVECGLYCVSMEAERAGGLSGVKRVIAYDYLTGEELDATGAAWVVDSDVRPMMSDVSRVAFKDLSSAGAFVKQHGGRVVDFAEAYEGSVSEWRR
jgi:hypothetical protein